jgi:hypothetical protein
MVIRVGLIRAFHGPAPSSKNDNSGTLAFLVVLVCQGYHIKAPQTNNLVQIYSPVVLEVRIPRFGCCKVDLHQVL